MKFLYRIGIILIIFSSCEKILYDEPDNTPENNFEVFWSDFDKFYAQFQIRKINWDSVYNIYHPKISSTTSDLELYNILAEIIGFINDGHVNLYAPFGTTSCNDCLKDYPSAKLINPEKYIIPGPPQPNGEIIEYRSMVGNDIGYIMLKSFSSTSGINGEDEKYLVIDDILQEFSDKSGLIIDVRWNGGGNSNNAETIASRFADKKRLYIRSYSKNGAGKNDFSDWGNVYIEPDGAYQYTNPVVLLTSRKTFSSAEVFVAAMKVFPNVTLVGDTTGRGIGNPIFRELPNGWTFRLSTKVAATADSHIIEGNGIYPDITVLTTIEDSINGIDRILEKGIEILQ